MGFTDEQVAIIDAFRSGQNLTISAGAGAGKTTTLVGAAAVRPNHRGIYTAFNKKIIEDSRRKFGPNVKCATLHSLAYGAVVPNDGGWRQRRMGTPRQHGRHLATILGINDPHRLNEFKVLAPGALAGLAMAMVRRYCDSDAPEIKWWHLPSMPGMDDKETRRAIGTMLLPAANRAWRDITSPHGKLRYEHGYYVKEWVLTDPQLGADFALLDEAQDSNGVTMALFRAQRNTQIVTVGDENQAIYGWRGAVDAMREFGGTRLTLTQSFRFGPEIADEANKWLELLGADLRIRGFEKVGSRLGAYTDDELPNAILCRTNAEAITRVMGLQEAGVRVALLGGGTEMKRLAEAARDLMERNWTGHPELTAFASWGQVQDYVENDEGGEDLRTFVRLIDAHGPESVVAAMDRLSDSRYAHVTVSTAHKCKGAEWDGVKVAGDFKAPKPDDDGRTMPEREAAMLAYVTVTRAKTFLDRGSLAWVDDVLHEHRFGIPVQTKQAPVASVDLDTIPAVIANRDDAAFQAEVDAAERARFALINGPATFGEAVAAYRAEQAAAPVAVMDAPSTSMFDAEPGPTPGLCGAKRKTIWNTWCTLPPHGPETDHQCQGVRPWTDAQCETLSVRP